MPAVSEGLIRIHQFTLDNHLNCLCLPSSFKPGFRNCIFPKAFGPATLAFRSVVLKLHCILVSRVTFKEYRFLGPIPRGAAVVGLGWGKHQAIPVYSHI